VPSGIAKLLGVPSLILYAIYNNATQLLLVLKQVLAKVGIDVEDLDLKPNFK